MVKKILMCVMCLVLLCTCVYAQRQMPRGNPPDGMENMQPPEGMQPQGQAPQQNVNNTPTESTQPAAEQAPNQSQEQVPEQQLQPNANFGGGMPGGFNWNNTQTEPQPVTFWGFVNEYQTPVISVVLLIGAFIFVKLYKRKNF